MEWRLGEPSERQEEFLKARERYVAYGGARGGGKSWAIRKKAVLLGLAHAGIRILVMRRTYDELRQNHIDPLRVDTRGFANYNDNSKTLTFVNGSMIIFGYCANKGDLLRYQGNEYDVIFIDEATQMEFDVFDVLKACVRGVNAFPKRIYLTCNPGGVGHAWVKRLFVDRIFYDGEDAADYRPLIRATVYDNGALMRENPEYVRQLESYTGDRRRAWLEGDWDVYDGLFFPDFARAVCEPFTVPQHWRRYRVIDYGLDRLACLWIAVAEDGKAYVYDELCASNLIVSEAARRILLHREDAVFCTYAPSDIWGRSQESGKSRAELFAAAGLPLVKVKSGRVDGWMAVKEWLKPVKDYDGAETTMLRVFSSCRELVRCMKEIQHDEGDVEDAATEPHELTHAPDALRYWCVSRTLAAERMEMVLRRQEKDYEEWTEQDELDSFTEYGQ